MSDGPARDCVLCPRLAAYRADNAKAHPDWFNGPVPPFGTIGARLLVIGLAPGVTGANRTGRPFTGDWAGDLLYSSLKTYGFAEGEYDKRPDDGFQLVDARVTNAVRCVPPQNKPVGAEINACRSFLTEEITAMADLKVILCLGRISHDSTLRALGRKPSQHAFSHGSEHEMEAAHRPVTLLSSYHCSRYNTNTGRLTEEMFHTVVARARALADAA